jgi:ABC-type antimicrobial peptide transport system permease subunit
VHRSSMCRILPARVAGFVFLTVGIGLGLLLLSLLLEKPSQHSNPFIVVDAKITTVTSGQERQGLRTYQGQHIRYRYLVSGTEYEGKFFRRQFSLSDYRQGQSIPVVFHRDDPANSWRYTDPTLSIYLIIGMIVVMFLFACVGISMMIAGRDFLHDWKRERNPWQ